MVKYYIKSKRIFTKWRQWAWFGTFIIAVGGLFEPLLGLIVLAVMAGLMITSFLCGRWWCGNVCTHGSFYDLILIKFSRNIKIPQIFRSWLAVLAFLAFFMFNMGRGMINAFTSVDVFKTKTLFLFPSQVDTTSIIGFLRAVGFVFVNTYWIVIVVSIALGLIFTSRAWCCFCPMGTFQRIFYKLGKALGVTKKTDVKISAKSKMLCHSCAKCNRVCPMQLHPYLGFDDKHQFNSDKCIKCKTCVVNCPAHILELRKAESAPVHIKPEHSAVIQSLIKPDEKILEIIFKINSTPEFTPGQFILVKVNNDPKMNRAYSISGFDPESKTFRVTVKRVPDGFGSDIVFNSFKVGQEITLEGPMGQELIVDKTTTNILLVAGGIGVTPFLSILADLTHDPKFSGSVHFIYGVNKENELLYFNDILELAKNHDNIIFTPVVAFERNYPGEKGFVTNIIEKLSLDNTKIYMYGPPPMVAAVKKILDKMGFDQKNLFVESA